MKTFEDGQSRQWTVDINVASMARVKSQTDVDLTRSMDPDSDVMRKLTDDFFLMFDVLCAVLQPQLDQHGLTVEQFQEAFDEEATERAATALFEAIIDFFREDKRTLLRRAFSKVKMTVEKTQAEAIQRMLQEVETEAFDQAIHESMFGSSSTNSPESLESTPAP